MRVEDPLWLACFGTTDSQIEPPPKPPAKPRRLKRHQAEAKLITAHPELLGGKSKTPSLFPEGETK